jgi:hypothetical protein
MDGSMDRRIDIDMNRRVGGLNFGWMDGWMDG